MSTEGAPALRRALRVVADVTFISGAAQMLKPELILGELSGDRDALSRHLFGTVGMFMAVSGGTLHRALAVPGPDRRLLLWAALQKAGASTAVCIGVSRGLFARRALLVAAFDMASGLLCLVYSAQLPLPSPET
jgi:hypothetical protein